MNDFLGSLAVSSLAGSFSGTLYAGTGDIFDLPRGVGILKSTDGGVTWTALASTDPSTNSDWYYVDHITINSGGTMLVTTGVPWSSGGAIYRSTDGGQTFTQVQSGASLDVEFDPNNDNDVVAESEDGTVRYSSDAGQTWSAPVTVASGGGRIALAFAADASHAGWVYASLDNSPSAAPSGQIYRSTDDGQTWTLLSSPGQLCSGFECQGWYDNTLWVDPGDATHLVTGGIDLFQSTDGGSNWTQISNWQNMPTSPHADQHAIVSAPGNPKQVYIGNDGGLYGASDITAATKTSGWTELNSGLAVTQFYSVAGHAGDTASANGNIVPIIAGAQDNGTQIRDAGASNNNWTMFFGGDGGYTDVNPVNANYLYGEYVYLDLFQSTDGGQSANFFTQEPPDSWSYMANFIAPFLLDPTHSNAVFAGGQQLWYGHPHLQGWSWRSLSGATLPMNTNDFINAIGVDPGNDNDVWVGFDGGGIYHSTNAMGTTPTWQQVGTGAANARPTSIYRVPGSANTLYVGYWTWSSGNIYETTDGGTTWQQLGQMLPPVPVNDVTTDPRDSQIVYAATEIGLFVSVDGGQTWATSNQGPANVSVTQLRWFDPQTPKLLASTYGRGAWLARPANLAPVLNTISPGSAAAGSAAITLDAQGQKFATNATVDWNGTALTTSYVSATQLMASVPASDLTVGGTFTVTVTNPTPGGGTSSALSFTVTNPAPTLSGISPATAVAGSSATTLTLTGTGFVSTSTVEWNGTALTTSYVSATQLTASVPASDLTVGGTFTVTVTNPTPGGGTSSALSFTVTNPAPTLSGISPATAVAGSSATTLTLTGTGFVSTSTVEWNGTALTTSYVSATQLTATLPASDLSATGSFNVTVTNAAPGGGTSAAQTFTVADTAPTANNGTLTTSTNIAGSGTLSATNPDSGQTLTFSIVVQPSHGTVTITNASTGAYTYTPTSGYAGSDAFTFMANDGYQDSNTATVSVTVTDTAPTANNGTLTTSTNTAGSGTLSATNPDSGQTLTFSIVTAPSHGTVTITNASTGAYTYTPASGYAGSDVFTFKANDGYLDSNTAIESVTVNDTAPTANNGSVTTPTNTAVNGTLSASDPDSGQSLTFSIVAQPSHGTVSVDAATGVFTYTPAAGYVGSDAFTFKANDGYQDSNTATESVTVNDNPPTASGGSVTTPTDTTVNDTLNASDPDSGQSLTYSIVAQPNHGTVSITDAATGAFTYIPNTGYAGSDSFTFKANDGYQDSNTAAESVTVNDNAPTASLGSYQTQTGQAFNGQLQASDPDNGQSLTYSIVAQPAHGTVSVDAGTGAFTYTPNAGYAGSDSFTFKVNDGYLDSNTAIESVTVNDNPPAATDSQLSTGTNQPLSGQLQASNPDSGQSLTYSLVVQPAHGTVSVDASTGVFIYTPNTGYAGSDAFAFRVYDGYQYSNTATVSITVVDTPPTAIGASFSTPTNQPVSGQLQGNAGDAGQTLSFARVQTPAHGTVSVNTNGTFSYAPNTGYAGADSFTFTVNDGYQNAAPATVSITVNDGVPTASDASFSTPIDTAHSGQLQATNPDSGQSLTYSIVAQPGHGTVAITDASSGAYTYTPATGYIGADAFTFKVNDGYKDSNTATVSATVTDTAPVARNASYNVTANSSFTGQLQASAASSSQTLTSAIVSGPAHGSVSLDAGSGQFTYLPAHDYSGTDRFTFKANDGTLDSNTATVRLKVAAGALAQRSGSGGGAFGPWGLALLAALALLIAVVRRKKLRLRRFLADYRKGKTAALALSLVLAGSVLFAAAPARAADAGPWYAGVQANVIQPAGGRNSATAGFKGWTVRFGRHLGRHFAVEIERASYSDYPETLTATANWLNWGLRGLYFPWKSQGAFAPFILTGVGHQYEYRGDNSEPSNNSASLGLGFTSQPWSAPVAIRADIEAQHGFGGAYTDKIFSLGVVFRFGKSS